MKNCNDFQIHQCIEWMREFEAAKDHGSSRLQTPQGQSCFQCKGKQCIIASKSLLLWV